jgi:hypothetical protein
LGIGELAAPRSEIFFRPSTWSAVTGCVENTSNRRMATNDLTISTILYFLVFMKPCEGELLLSILWIAGVMFDVVIV